MARLPRFPVVRHLDIPMQFVPLELPPPKSRYWLKRLSASLSPIDVQKRGQESSFAFSESFVIRGVSFWDAHGRAILIQGSSDGGKSWREVHSFPLETSHVHGARGLRDIVFSYATPVKQ